MGQAWGVWEGKVRGGRYWRFGCWRFGQSWGVDSLKGQGVLGEAGAGWVRFCVIEFPTTEGAAYGAEADDIVGGVVHVDDHGGE